MNVEHLLEEERIPFRSQGKDCVVRCLHPEHEDKGPSLRIDRISGVFHCFSCGFKGNIFAHFGKQVNIVDAETAKLKNKITDMLNNITLEIPEHAEPFNHEYRGISIKTLRDHSAFTIEDEDEYKMLKDRIVFPVFNLYGHIKAFCGRRIHSDVDPKYLFYPKHVTIPLFPARPIELYNGSIILVEGIFDALNLIDKGLLNAVCMFGTNNLSKSNSINKIAYLEILGVTKIYIMLDGDEAGQKAAFKTENLLKRKFATEQIELPERRDPAMLTQDDVDLIKESIY